MNSCIPVIHNVLGHVREHGYPTITQYYSLFANLVHSSCFFRSSSCSKEGTSHPRIALFAKLCGIPVAEDDLGRSFRPFALTDFFLPIVLGLVSSNAELFVRQIQRLFIVFSSQNADNIKPNCSLPDVYFRTKTRTVPTWKGALSTVLR